MIRPTRLTPEPAGSELSLFLLVEVFFRHLKLFLLVSGLVFASALFWIFGTPRKYESHASILVQNARRNLVITAGNTDNPMEMRELTEEELDSDLEVLTSRDLLDEVLKPGWHKKPLAAYSRTELLDHEKALANLMRRLDATVVRKSNVMQAVITAPSPEQAQLEMQRLIAAFMARQRQISRPPGAARFFAEQAERYRKDLAQAQMALAEFQNKQNLVNVNERETTLSSNVTNAENQRRDADVQIRELEKRIEANTSLLETLPNRQTTQERTTPLTGALDQLTSQLVALKNQQTELLISTRQPTARCGRLSCRYSKSKPASRRLVPLSHVKLRLTSIRHGNSCRMIWP